MGGHTLATPSNELAAILDELARHLQQLLRLVHLVLLLLLLVTELVFWSRYGDERGSIACRGYEWRGRILCVPKCNGSSRSASEVPQHASGQLAEVAA